MDQVSPVRPSIHRSIPASNPGTSISSLVAKMTNRHQITNRLLKQSAPNTAENTPPSTSSQNSTSFLQPPPPNYRKKKRVKLQPLHGRLSQCPQPRTVPPNQSCDVSDGVIHRHGILPPIVVDGITSDCECGSDRTVGELSGYSSANDFHSDFSESDVTIDFLSASASNESLLDRSVSQQGRRQDEDDGDHYRHLPDSPYPLCPPNSVSGSLGSDQQSNADKVIVQDTFKDRNEIRKEVSVCKSDGIRKSTKRVGQDKRDTSISSGTCGPAQSSNVTNEKLILNESHSKSGHESCGQKQAEITCQQQDIPQLPSCSVIDKNSKFVSCSSGTTVTQNGKCCGKETSKTKSDNAKTRSNKDNQSRTKKKKVPTATLR